MNPWLYYIFVIIFRTRVPTCVLFYYCLCCFKSNGTDFCCCGKNQYCNNHRVQHIFTVSGNVSTTLCDTMIKFLCYFVVFFISFAALFCFLSFYYCSTPRSVQHNARTHTHTNKNSFFSSDFHGYYVSISDFIDLIFDLSKKVFS